MAEKKELRRVMYIYELYTRAENFIYYEQMLIKK